jgi:HEAT repeat protein
MSAALHSLGDVAGRLRDPDRNVRVRAALDLGRRRDNALVEALVEALCTDPDFNVRETLVWALVRVSDAAVAPLIARLSDPIPLARMSAAHALGKIGDPRAVDALIEVLHDSDLEVVARAAFALGQIGDARAAPALVGVLGHDNRELEATMASVLERFAASAVQPLIRALGHENWRAREQAADALRVIGAKDAIPSLAPLLADPCWQVRFAAVNALGNLGEQLTPDLDEDPRVRALQLRLGAQPRPD